MIAGRRHGRTSFVWGAGFPLFLPRPYDGPTTTPSGGSEPRGTATSDQPQAPRIRASVSDLGTAPCAASDDTYDLFLPSLGPISVSGVPDLRATSLIA